MIEAAWGRWTPHAEAEAALAEKDRRIKELETDCRILDAQKQEWIAAVQFRGERQADLIAAGEALYKAVWNWRYFEPGSLVGIKLAAYREVSE